MCWRTMPSCASGHATQWQCTEERNAEYGDRVDPNVQFTLSFLFPRTGRAGGYMGFSTATSRFSRFSSETLSILCIVLTAVACLIDPPHAAAATSTLLWDHSS